MQNGSVSDIEAVKRNLEVSRFRARFVKLRGDKANRREVRALLRWEVIR